VSAVSASREFVVPPDASSVSAARAFVHAQCARPGLTPQDCDTVVLLTSEIVTNAIIHGHSEARVRVLRRSGCVRVEVADDNSRHPQQVVEDDDALDGRGLTIVQLLATHWGVRDDPFGKTVWFEVPAA
jgi:anti-sigma regulatory factor (Ser/Thr protein kinase)